MNEKDLSCLSYKELQALAVKYRVPGNIKKHLLIRVLQAVKSGNETEVEKILGELHQARKKKRLKKLKRDKMSVISTPVHSPEYAMSEDCYYPQQQRPYQWVGAIEEIASREEEPIRVPNYDEFERFLLRRIQGDYQSCGLNDNVQTQVPSIVDLRMGAGSSMLEPIVLDKNRVKSNIIIDSNSYARGCPRERELPMGEDTNNNNQGPVLLKKMLEAPAGANLEAIASPQKSSYRMWSSETYPNSNNVLDDSATLTADSEIDNEDIWEASNNINNASNGYHCIMNNNKGPTCGNQANAQDRALQESQLANNFLTVGTNHYQVVYPVSDVQANCEKWIATNSFVNRDASSMEQVTENSRGFNPIYYEETSGISTIMRPMNLERKNQYNGPNQNLIYEANQTILQGQMSNEPHQFYQSNNGVTTAPVNPLDVYYSQQMAKRVGETTQEYFEQGSYANTETAQNLYQSPAVHQDVPPAQFNDNAFNKEPGSSIQLVENNDVPYNAGYYQQYHHDNTQPMHGFPYVENPNQQPINQGHHHHHEHQQANVTEGQEFGARKNNAGPQTLQPIANGALDSFWPRWPINGTLTSNGQLETILNLRHCNYVDYAKIDQTSSVYSYQAPVVTQRIDATNPLCTQKRQRVAECRQHVFSPNRLVYNDASTGMRMAIMSDVSPMEIHAQEQSNSSTDHNSETRVYSTTSSENSINDVWIHDYSRYPVSSDNGPQSVGLIIDENEDDLFSL